ncbi:kinetochore complex Sim4 subunit Fta1-domain-containing protein [Hypoxylon rubiginosum]|uniref:Kinetochore complex Sim4 subunit Fta1-domain-containing protein n=1 Tax=Hypoxylon rubiginosum TaxID=110542 RepID=A0ACC0D4Q9_9PEZI|nr:kinetochore complex Sim4 subunit Fta1-domain-containing protein [Hypoxylon rubiginosum]
MPPRRRKRDDAPTATAAASPSPSPSPAPEEPPSPQSDDATPSSFSSRPDDDDDEEPPRFFNTTFTTYRASPLYLSGKALTPARLQLLSRRLRDALVGDVVRGVQVGLVGESSSDGGALSRTGALEAVVWRWVDAARILGRERQGRSVELGGQDDSEDRERGEEEDGKKKKRVLCIELRYENARFSAMLMPDFADGEDPVASGAARAPWAWQQDSNGNGEDVDRGVFLHLPLVIFRMPAPLKSVLISFLSNTFDCRISPLALGTRTLVSSWEAWLSDSRQAVSKDVLFTLGFHIEPPESESKDPKHDGGEGPALKPGPQQQQGLKTIDIAIPAAEVHRFLRVGEAQTAAPTNKRKPGAATVLSEQQQSRRRRKLAGGKDEEGWAWRGDAEREEEKETIEQPFTEALAAYTWHHLGLDMFHPGVRVQRVACDAFALSEGRLKVFAPAGGDNGAVWRLVRDLARRARGNSGWGSGAAIGMTISQ